MSSVPLNPDTAKKRHTVQVEAISKGLGADHGDIDWSYDWGVRIDGSERTSTHKGIDIFLQNPERYGISLLGKHGRKRRHEALDSSALAQDPNQWPREMFERAKPDGPSMWVWQPRRQASPGWNEAVVVSCLEDPKTGAVELQAQTDEGQTEIFVRTDGEWETGFPGQSNKRWKAVPAESILEDFEQGCMRAGEESIGDLLRQLGAEVDPEMGMDDDEIVPEPGTGRKWNWGQSIDKQDIEPYTRLMDSLQGPSSGNALAVLSGLGNPSNQIKRQVASDMLTKIAMGLDAMEAAKEVIGENPDLPDLPEGHTDIAGFIEANTKAARPVHIRPIILGRR